PQHLRLARARSRLSAPGARALARRSACSSRAAPPPPPSVPAAERLAHAGHRETDRSRSPRARAQVSLRPGSDSVLPATGASRWSARRQRGWRLCPRHHDDGSRDRHPPCSLGSMSFATAAIEPCVRRLVADRLGVSPEDLIPEASLADELAVDSLDVLEIAIAL